MQVPKDVETNPYQATTQTQADTPDQTSPPRSRIAQHLTAVIVIGFVSLVVAMLVTPADPMSMIAAVVPIFVMALSAYWIGFRKRRKSVEQRSK
jgi:L-asparagine transporter-like permease